MRNDANTYQYYKRVQECFADDAMAVLLIKTVTWLNPCLAEYGLGFDKPIAVISEDNESMIQIAKELHGFNRDEVRLITSSPKEIKTCFQNSSYGIAFFKFEKGRYALDNLAWIGNECGKIVTDIGRRKTVIVFAEGGIPNEYAEYFAGFVYISAINKRDIRNDRESADQFLHDLIDYVLTGLNFIIPALRDKKKQGFDIAGWVLKTLIKKDILMRESEDKYIVEVDTSIKKLKSAWDSPSNSAAICALFCKTLYNPPEIVKMYDRRRAPGISEKNIECAIYYDKDYYYLPTALYSRLCASVPTPYGEKYIKNQLVSAGILVANGIFRNYDTVHTDITTAYGCSYRKRMMKLDRSLIDKEGYPTLQQVLQDEEEEGEKERGIELGWSLRPECKVHIAGDTMNESILITGMSGSGKSYALNVLAHRLADRGDAVVALGYHSVFSQIEESTCVRRINVRTQGLPLSFVFSARESDEEDLIEAVTDVLCSVKKLRTRQKRRLRENVKQAVRRNDGDMIRSLKRLLEEAEDEVSESIYEEFREIFTEVRINQGMDLFENGKITILDFEDFSPDIQKVLAELTLSALWRDTRMTGQGREGRRYVMADEFQVLNTGNDSVFNQILREGRKFALSMIIATQTLGTLDSPQRTIAQQAATHLYFHPADGEVGSIVRYIGVNHSDKLAYELRSLQRGECIAAGRLCLKGKTMEEPLKVSFVQSKPHVTNVSFKKVKIIDQRGYLKRNMQKN